MRSIGSDSEGDMMVGRKGKKSVAGGGGCAISFCIGGRLFWKGKKIGGDREEVDAVRKK